MFAERAQFMFSKLLRRSAQPPFFSLSLPGPDLAEVHAYPGKLKLELVTDGVVELLSGSSFSGSEALRIITGNRKRQ